MQVSFRKSLLVGSVISLLLVILTGVLSVIMFQRQSQKADWVSHTYRVLYSIKDIDNAAKETRAARRSYRSTGDPRYLESYYTSLKGMYRSQKDLDKVLMDNRAQLKISKRLRLHLADMIAYSESIPPYEPNTPERVRRAVINNENRLMAFAKEDISQLIEREQRLLRERIASNKRLINWVIAILVISIVTASTIVGTLILLVMREFKKRIKFQEELRKSNVELKKVVKEKEEINKQLERFSYVVAHDLKSPLSGVIGAAEVLGMDERLTKYDDIKKMSSLMYNTALKLSDKISSVLEYSKVSAGNQKMEEVDVHSMVENVIYFLFPPRHIKAYIAGELPVITTQKTKLQQVFQNLISNAIKYNDKKDGVIEIGGIDKGEYYQFYVKDNGPGIKESDKEKIFALFETSDNESSGESSTGIGLSLLKTLVEEQGGRIWVETTPGSGSVFYFLWRK